MTTHLVIVGAGALGSHVLLFCRNIAAQFTVIDFDRVEQKNTLSQFHTKMGMGRNKAVALQQTMQGLFGLKIKAVPHALTTENAQLLLSNADLVLDCVDNLEARQLITATVRELGIPCLHGALSAEGTSFARVMWDEAFAPDAGGEGEATCENGEELPFIANVAAQLASVTREFLEKGTRRSLHIHPTGMIETGSA